MMEPPIAALLAISNVPAIHSIIVTCARNDLPHR